MTKINPDNLFELLFNSEQARETLKTELEDIFKAKVEIKITNEKETNPYEEAYTKGYNKGLTKGIIQREEEIVKNMINKNFDSKTISELTQLTEKEIKNLI